MKFKVIKLLIGILLISFVLYVYPIGKLMFSNAEVTKAIFWDEYYVKVSSDKYEYDIFCEYMESKGWIENKNKRFGGLHVFENNGDTKEIVNTDIKTVIINGKLNFQSFIRNCS